MQAHATMHGVSTIAIPKIGCGLDQTNWQDIVKLIRNIFAYSDIQIVAYSLDEHAIHAMSAEGDPDFYAEDEIDRYSEEFQLSERELETDFTSDVKSCQQTATNNSQSYARRNKTRLLLNTISSTNPKS